MNVSDVTVGRTAEIPVTMEINAPPARETMQEQQKNAINKPSRGDEYIPAPEVNVSNALYDVHNVSGRASVLVSSAPTRNISFSGETVGRKIAEFLLPIGRKSLTIYSMNVQNLKQRDLN